MRLLTRLSVPFLVAGGLAFQALAASAASVPVSMACGPPPIEYCFSPATVTIQAGDTVVWTNTTGAIHTATANDRSWDTGRVDPGQSRGIPFPTPGTFPYFCTFHQRTMGTVIVNPAATPTPTGSPGPTSTPAPTATRRPGGLSPTGGGPPVLPAVAVLTLLGLALLRRRR